MLALGLLVLVYKNKLKRIMTTNKIDRFIGEYSFLSNFFLSPVKYNGVEYRSIEHAYQAAKATTPIDHDSIASATTPAKAKKLARFIILRPGWDGSKVGLMEELVWAKFSIPELKEKLLATGDAILIEGNWWNDTFWGICKGKGQNILGKILMNVREELRTH